MNDELTRQIDQAITAVNDDGARLREPTADERAGMAWWNDQTPHERSYWCRAADSPRPADAWAAYKRHAARDRAAAADPQSAWDQIGGDPR